MARVACIMMQKNEGELLRVWIEYHRRLFGEHNLFIFDNNSTDPLTLAILEKYQRLGLSVNRHFDSPDAHTKRGTIFGDLIKRLDRSRDFDFFVPIDCDEFFVLKQSGNKVSAIPGDIHKELSLLVSVDQVLGMTRSYYNILGQSERFFDWEQEKVFFRRGTFERMDSGFHTGVSRLASGRYETRFSHIHYHHKPYDVLVQHSKNKLRAFFNPDDPQELARPENKNRLTDFILAGEQKYMERFQTDKGLNFPEFTNYLKSIHVQIPFSEISAHAAS